MTVWARPITMVMLVLVGWFIPSGPAFTKGPVDKITLTGPGLTHPIEIAGPGSFNPWTRGFVLWSRGPVNEPPPPNETYTVSFYLKASERPYCVKREGELCLIYVLQYSLDPLGGPGHLYFPGPGEPSYRVNKGTIITASSDLWDPNGKWHYATEQWDTLIRHALREEGNVTPGSASLTARSVTEPAVATGDPVSAPLPSSRATSAGSQGFEVAIAMAAVALAIGAAGFLWLRIRQKPG